MIPEVMQFSCCDHPFRVGITRCADFECECTELYFSLREVTDDGRPVPEGRTLEVRVDGDTWQEIDAPSRDAQSEQMVRELLDGYPTTGKEHLQQDVREKRRAVRRLRNFRLDPDMIAEGTLVAFGEIISDRRHGAKVWSFAYDWEHDGDYYLLEDLYCCNPTCPCRDVHVSFFRCSRSTKTQRKPVTEEQFVAILSLDGKWRIGNCYKCSEAKAKELLRAWRQDEPDFMRSCAPSLVLGAGTITLSPGFQFAGVAIWCLSAV